MPNSEDSNYVNKPFLLNLDDPEEKKLYDWLRELPKREFKKQTKAYWLNKMKGENPK